MKLFISMLFIGCIIGFSAAQNIIYVYPGTDQISYAVQFQAFPGDIIELADGDYIENQTVEIPIDLTVRGAQGATVKWFVPASAKDGIHIKGNVHLENIIFETDSAEMCVVNMFGSVTPGEEAQVDKNNIYVNHCQFIQFRRRVIWIPDPTDMPDGKAHPVDTLCVTNSLIYGGHTGIIPDPVPIDLWGNPVPNPDAGTYYGIRAEYGQVRVAKIKYCTFWLIWDKGIKIQGPMNDPDYLELLVDHCTFFDGWKCTGVYFLYCNEDDTVRNSIFYKLGSFGIKQENSQNYVVEYNCADSIGWRLDVGQPYHYNLIIGKENLTDDPLFRNPEIGDFTLMDGSPCIGTATDGSDRGNNEYTVWNPGTWNHSPAGLENNSTLIPGTLILRQNYPNPFNPRTIINYELPITNEVELSIFNLFGQRVATLVNEKQNAGNYQVEWNASDLASGVYYYRLSTSAGFVQAKKLVLLK